MGGARCGRLRLRLVAVAAVLCAAVAFTARADVTRSAATAVSNAAARDRITGLPLAAQGPVSAALGREERSYRVLALQALNPAQHLHVVFARRTVTVAAGAARLGVTLSAYGYRDALQALGPATPHARGNRVAYVHGSLSEWFANGPLGLEQGFELAARPRAGGGPLTISLTLSGNLRPRLERGSLSLSGAGVSLHYGSLLATDARGRVLHSWLQQRGDRLSIAVDDRRAAYPLRIDPFIQRGELSARHGSSGEEFGEAVAISGRTIVVGTPNYTAAATGAEQGAVYVFTAPASGWAHARQSAVLRAPRGQPEELFGHAVALSGNVIVVGAPFREVGGHTGQGAAYVFVKPHAAWRNALPTAKLTARHGAAHEFFGESVAIAGGTVLAGAPGRRVGANAMQGAVDVFNRPAAGWGGSLMPSAKLTASDGRANDALGISVAISGRTIAAGADLHALADRAAQGAVYVFVAPSSGWRKATQTAELSDEAGEAGELLGHSVAISGTTIVAGAPYRAVAGKSKQGAVDVFSRPPSGWAGALTHASELTASDGSANEALGRTVAISGGTIVAGADFREIGKSPEEGAAYVFVKPSSGSNATQTEELTAANGTTGDNFGRSVAISGATIVVGAADHAIGKSLGQGAVYAFVGGFAAAEADELR